MHPLNLKKKTRGRGQIISSRGSDGGESNRKGVNISNPYDSVCYVT